MTTTMKMFRLFPLGGRESWTNDPRWSPSSCPCTWSDGPSRGASRPLYPYIYGTTSIITPIFNPGCPLQGRRVHMFTHGKCLLSPTSVPPSYVSVRTESVPGAGSVCQRTVRKGRSYTFVGTVSERWVWGGTERKEGEKVLPPLTRAGEERVLLSVRTFCLPSWFPV